MSNSRYITISSIHIMCYLSLENAKKLAGIEELKWVYFYPQMLSKSSGAARILLDSAKSVLVVRKPPGRRKSLDHSRIREARELYLSGLSIRKISSLLGVSRGVVWRTVSTVSKPLSSGEPLVLACDGRFF